MTILARIGIGGVLILFFVLASLYIYRFGTMLFTKGVPTISTFRRQYKLLEQLDIPAGSKLLDL